MYHSWLLFCQRFSPSRESLIPYFIQCSPARATTLLSMPLIESHILDFVAKLNFSLTQTATRIGFPVATGLLVALVKYKRSNELG